MTSQALSPAIDLRVEPDLQAAWSTAAEVIARAIATGVSGAGTAAIAVSGGDTPRGLHRLLAEPPWVDAIPWDRLHVFWADERLVPYHDPASNFGTALHDWLDRLPHGPSGVHPVPVDLPPQDAADCYSDELRTYFGRRRAAEPILDLAVLGIGSDGHTASLFPHHPVLEDHVRWTAAVKGGNPDVWRVTLTYPILNRARRVLFLVAGESKAEVVRRILSGASPPLPAQRVRPAGGEIIWVLDRAAARLVEKLGG